MTVESTTVATAASTGTTSAIPMTSTSTANKHARDDMSTTMTGIPLVDMRPFLEDPRSHEAMVECRKAATGTRRFGVLTVRDPRTTHAHNDHFLDMLERYFAQEDARKMEDVREEFAFQVGATPAFQETPKCAFDPGCLELIRGYTPENRPIIPTTADAKWRYFWRIGTRPPSTAFPELNAAPVIPAAFAAEWPTVMDQWGAALQRAVEVVAKMVAVGFGLDEGVFGEVTDGGPHLLAPTGSDLGLHSELNTVLAGFHYDLNFLTIHGKSRYPGLSVWTREGAKMDVRVPDGCLLVQAGKQMEYLTGGIVRAGYHQVIVTPATQAAIAAMKQTHPERPLWRISSTLFHHVASDVMLRPLDGFVRMLEEQEQEGTSKEEVERVLRVDYEPILTGHFVERELQGINLKR